MKTLEELRVAAGIPESSNGKKFLASTKIDQQAWRDGDGYDLRCLASMTAQEQELIQQWLAGRLQPAHAQLEWRDLEAASALGAEDLLTALEDHSDPEVRLRVAQLLGQSDNVEKELCDILHNGRDGSSMSKALDRVADIPTESVRQALISRVRKLDGNFIPAAMVLLEVFGGEDAWNERPFLFRVQSQGAQGELMKELLARCGGAPSANE